MIQFLHTRIRVSDLDRSIRWYCEMAGFRVYQHMNKSPAGNQIVHLELPGNKHMLELTYSPDYVVKVPEDLVHTCIGVEDIIAYCAEVETKGAEVWPEDWREKFGKGGLKMAFLTDPDGYELEILETKNRVG